MNPIVLSIPLFFVLIGLEVLYDRFRNKKLYRLNDALTNISCGITEQLSGVFAAVFTVGIYQLVFTHCRLFEIPIQGWSLALLFLLVDFCYYWAHRWSHEINLFWAGHVVHHQSEEYNLSVALRQGAFQKLFTALVYLPLAVLGFPTEWFLLLLAYNTLYQFWIHTQTIGKMGWLEWVLNTPSHHRVHHGRDPRYIDKNHGGSLIIWDRLFGTFQEEDSKPVYGITQPVNSWNPVYLQVNHWERMATDLKKVKGWKNKLKLLFYKPGWLPDELGGYRAPQPIDPHYRAFDTRVSLATNGYVLSQYGLVLAFTSYVLFNVAAFSTPEKLVLVTVIFVAVWSLGRLLEARKGRLYELVRIGGSVAVLAWLLPITTVWWLLGFWFLLSITALYVLKID
jgi:sterol desaturase/sphingolipid hydroxylase (fatty acid hydroxylase superfamily)